MTTLPGSQVPCTAADCGYINTIGAEVCVRCGNRLDGGALDAMREVPPLPENATPEQKEEHWYRYVYQGDNVKQLTFRAVLMGGLLGSVLSISNLYTTLHLGWAFGVAITACVLSYVIWNALRVFSGRRLTAMSILENNCMQSTASAAGYSTGATIGTAFAALLLITGEHVRWYILLPFTFFTALLGVFLAVPLKRQMINIERLPFPSGIAAAETLRSLYSKGVEAMRKAYALVISLFAGFLIGLLRTGEGLVWWLDKFFFTPVLGGWRIPELIRFERWTPTKSAPISEAYGFEPSALLIGAGMIVGLRVCLSMLLGTLLLYLWIGPALHQVDLPHLGDPNYIVNIPLAGGGTVLRYRLWGLWGGCSLMVFSSFASLALQWRTIARSFTSLRGGQVGTRAEMARIEVPIRWLIIGLLPITLGLVVVQYLAFSIVWWMGLIAVAASFIISLVCCRATGETDTTPIGPMGKVTQLLFALIAPGNTTTNLMTASVTANAAGSASDLLIDLKSGYLLGAHPRKQFIAQAVGVFFGTAAIVPAWYLMVPSKEIMEQRFALPNTQIWKAVAEALTKGLEYVPVSARWAILWGALAGTALPVIGALWPKANRFLPSAMGLGLSWVMPFANAFAFAIGAVIAWIWSLIHRRNADTYTIPVASGFIAGESLMSAAIAILATLTGWFWKPPG